MVSVRCLWPRWVLWAVVAVVTPVCPVSRCMRCRTYGSTTGCASFGLCTVPLQGRMLACSWGLCISRSFCVVRWSVPSTLGLVVAVVVLVALWVVPLVQPSMCLLMVVCLRSHSCRRRRWCVVWRLSWCCRFVLVVLRCGYRSRCCVVCLSGGVSVSGWDCRWPCWLVGKPESTMRRR